jgi:cytoskeletal protein RodZ
MRNFLYNKSDILVAVVIVVVAIIIIWSRIDAIMGSDSATKNPPGNTTGQNASDSEEEPAGTDDNTVQPDDGSVANEGAVETPPAETNEQTTETPAVGTNVKFKVKSGMSSGEIATALKDAGLVASVEEFNTAMEAQNAETKLRAGTFDIPAGSTPAQIVTILLK